MGFFQRFLTGLWGFLLMALPSYSQSTIPDIQWVKTQDWYYATNIRIAITSDGGIYAAGYKFSTKGDTLVAVSSPNYPPGATADGGVLGLYFELTYLPRMDSRIFYTNWGIQKKSADGQLVFRQSWYQGFGPGGPMYPAFESIKKILGTPDNGHVILNAENTPGYSYGSLSRYNAGGEKQWTNVLLHQTANGPTPVRGETVINTPDGGLLITGYLPGIIDDPFNADNPSTGWVIRHWVYQTLITEFLKSMRRPCRPKTLPG